MAMKSSSSSSSSCLPISSVNHISLLCSSVEKSAAFYEDVLGFFPIRRPGSFDFDGAWLFNYGMGIHLIQAPNPSELPKKVDINPKDNHMSFQTGCHDIEEVEERLKELGVRYIRVQVEEGGILVDQIFFHDPDGFMIEVCTCENLPLVPLKGSPSALSLCSLQNASITTAANAFNCSQQYSACLSCNNGAGASIKMQAPSFQTDHM
ncbi:hypothetical protein GOP47_0007732 [Adiantum capillus-veneris]|uniref:VOC domain-containing protein n=1 Tax=Adiantum capillus-veneris TaxID=13818 RepID=A0A9D4V1G1_ADICA|nr:hypothetical protein GOP47_0007732 [Adiantum capillus-veneris]